MGTDKGLFCYDARLDNFRELPLKAGDGTFISGRINDMLIDRVGNLWIAAGLDGVFNVQFSTDTDTLLHFSAQGRNCKCVEEDDEGGIWVGTIGSGLLKYDRKQNTFRFWPTKGRDIGSVGINDLLSGDGRLYLGTFEEGLLVLQKDSVHIVECSNFSLQKMVIHTLARNTASEILIGGEAFLYYNEISRKAKVHRHVPSNPHSLSDGSIYSIYKDREKGLWLGTYFEGINYMPYPYAPFRIYYPQSDELSLPGERVREMCEDRYGRLWVGTEGSGLSCMDVLSRQFISFSTKHDGPSLFGNNIHGLACDDDYLWIGYYMGGFDRYDLVTGRVRHRSLTKLMGRNVNEDIFAICRSKFSNRLWIGTVAGVYSYDIDADTLAVVDEVGFPFVYDIDEQRLERGVLKCSWETPTLNTQ